ncbi:MAG: metalloregulator ArsR/SmtB family transcription factor [Pseudomonadota bacterium]|nr:metalloregulator ArsR/SmtB family transcription factor [Pseudomonadota bacterium]
MSAVVKEVESQGAGGVSIDLVALHAAFCTIFSSPVRLQIMDMLGPGEKSVGVLAEQLKVSMANVSQHLRLMRNQGAVSFRKDGKTVYYRVANQKFIEGIEKVREGLIEELRKKGEVV